MDKANVNGPNAHEVFKFLRSHSELHDAENHSVGHIHWNFGKFLVDGATGKQVRYLHSRSEPEEVLAAIKEHLSHAK